MTSETDVEKKALEESNWHQRCDTRHHAWVQLRYHRRRQRFFDLCDKLTKTVTILLGATLFGVAVKEWVPLLGSLVSSLGLLSLIFGYSDRKQQHKDLSEQAANLIFDIEATPLAEITSHKVAGWNAGYVRICTKAPPALKTLTLICEREQSSADGNPNHIPEQKWLDRLLADFKS